MTPSKDGAVQATTILEEATAAVFGARQVAYGHPSVTFARIAHLWNGWLRANNVRDSRGGEFEFDPEDVADLFILTKLARLMEDPTHRDSHIDIAGYAEARARALNLDA